MSITLMIESFQDLTNLAIALSTAVNTRLMSPEEATGLWRKSLIEVGLKQTPPQPVKETIKKVAKVIQEG